MSNMHVVSIIGIVWSIALFVFITIASITTIIPWLRGQKSSGVLAKSDVFFFSILVLAFLSTICVLLTSIFLL